MIGRALVWASTRRCHGCDDPSPHSHHLTWVGRARYTDDRGAADIAGVPIMAALLIGLVVVLDINYNHGQIVHAIGDWFRVIFHGNGK